MWKPKITTTPGAHISQSQFGSIFTSSLKEVMTWIVRDENNESSCMHIGNTNRD